MLITLIIKDVICVIGGYSKGAEVNTLQSYDMAKQKWATLPPMKERRSNPAVCLQGDRIIVAGGHNGSKYLDTCEAFQAKSKRFVFTQPCRASHHYTCNAVLVNLQQLSTCSWSTLPRMTAKRVNFSFVCLPDTGGLIAIGGYINGSRLDVVDCVDGESAREWRRLAPLPLPLSSPDGGVYFKQRILVVGGYTTGGTTTSATLVFHPPAAGGPGQWATLKATLPRPEYPRHITICGSSLFLVSKFTSQPDCKFSFNLTIQTHFKDATP